MASSIKKQFRAQQARRHRSYIKDQLKTVLEGVEDIPENKGTDFLITTLVKHALQWKTIYYNSSECQDQETSIQRRNYVKEKVLNVLKEIEGVSRDVETDFDSLVEILVNHSKYLKEIYDTQQTQYIYNENIYMETDNQPFDNSFESKPTLEDLRLRLLGNANYAAYQPPKDQNYFPTEPNNDHQPNNENSFQANSSSPQETNQETYTIHHQEEHYQETNENNVTTTEEVMRTSIVKRKRKRTLDKSKHVCNPENIQKRFRKTIDLLIKRLEDII